MTKIRNISTFVDVFRWTVRTGVRVSPPPLSGSYYMGLFLCLKIKKKRIICTIKFMNKYLKINYKLDSMHIIKA